MKNEVIDNLSAIVTDFDNRMTAMREELAAKFKGEFTTIFAEIFKAYPNVEKVAWTQYTPYFNDGDPCVFGVNGLHIKDETVDADDEDDIYEWVELWGDKANTYPLLKQFEGVLSRSEDTLLSMFGDHVRVVVTREGMDVEDYEHD